MANDRQIAANRRNARLSNGPRTEAGKSVSRRNAMTHGLTAEVLLLDGEDPVIFELLRAELFGEFEPVTSYETQLTHQLASLIWRLRRIPAFETAILSWMTYRQVEIFGSDDSRNVTPSNNVMEYGGHMGLRAGDWQDAKARHAQLLLGRLLEAEMNKDLTAKLGRYEAHLMRQLKQTRTELLEWQTARAKKDGAGGEHREGPRSVNAATSDG